MRLITANIGRGLSVQHTRADLETIKALKGIVGFQEIDEADAPPEHELISAVLGSSNDLIGMEHYVPLAVPKKDYEVVSSRVVFGTGGVKRYSPSRFFSVALVRAKSSLLDRIKGRTHKVFVVINTHYPAGAYHGNRPAAAREELKKHWDEQYKVHRELIKFYADKGYTVFWTGDVNRMVMPKVHPREVMVVTVGIDSISYIEGDIKVKFLRRDHARLYSDHDAQYADFKLSYE